MALTLRLPQTETAEERLERIRQSNVRKDFSKGRAGGEKFCKSSVY
jgi:hypothetical protein